MARAAADLPPKASHERAHIEFRRGCLQGEREGGERVCVCRVCVCVCVCVFACGCACVCCCVCVLLRVCSACFLLLLTWYRVGALPSLLLPSLLVLAFASLSARKCVVCHMCKCYTMTASVLRAQSCTASRQTNRALHQQPATATAPSLISEPSQGADEGCSASCT